MEITFKYEREEYVRAVRKYLITSKIISKSSIVLVPLINILSIIFIITDGSFISVLSCCISFLALIMGLTLYIYVPNRDFKIVNKYSEEYSLKFSRGRIEFKTDTIDSKIEMNLYKEFWKSREFYYLVQAKYQYTIIPRRVISEANEKKFEEMLVKNVAVMREI